MVFSVILTAVSCSPSLGDERFSLDVVLFECSEELAAFEWLQGLLGLAPGDDTGVLLEEFEEEQFVEVPVSLRMGFVRLMLETGGFIRSVVTGAAEVSAFLSFTPPVLVELPSNTINGLFLPLSALELKQNSYINKRKHVGHFSCSYTTVV